MSYTALYRKFRPVSFDDVKGQDHIVTTLRNQIKSDRIGHAYLFCGTRGTGKTTVAKILARSVNCETPVNGSPCGECPTCQAIKSGAALNIIEIDAASNNGVDNVREIIDEVAYSPTMGRYKVYIIDEVHMLSKGAFNALLKTLEEPPEYVIFILATTEPNALPVTILSRCQRYDFHRITIETIQGRLRTVCDEEGLSVDDKALRYIAKMGDGSMRDALSLLDQCIAFHIGETLTYDHALDVLGAVDTSVFDRLINAVYDHDVVASLNLLQDVVEQGRELSQFNNDLIWYVRSIMLASTDTGLDEIIDINTDDMAALKATAARIDSETVMRYIRELSELTSQLRYSPQKRILLEVTLIRMCKPGEFTAAPSLTADPAAAAGGSVDMSSAPGAPAPAATAASAVDSAEFRVLFDGLKARISMLEEKLASGSFSVKEDTPIKEAPRPEALPEDVEYVNNHWKEFMDSLPVNLSIYISEARRGITQDGRLELTWLAVNGLNTNFDRASDPTNRDIIDETLSELTGKHVDVVYTLAHDKRDLEEHHFDISQLITVEIETEDETATGYV
ncbi:DNA polymerase-3 subunit gamma/tau [Lachnospiraceae bacterium XBB2008]|nr:DNA polymerase-3 subunit gamma/tau [Lachnospiraceae bacterium XBB2008]